MGTKHRNLAWVFNGAEWAKAIRAQVKNDEYGALAELLGVSELTIARWATNTLHKAAPYPQMTNFIRVCNALELDPRNFWELEA